MDCGVVIPYMSQCARKQQHLLFSLISVEGKRVEKEENNQQMFTKERRSWQHDDELIRGLLVIGFLNCCSESRTAAADGSVKRP